jgi:hypothetical protein
MRIVLLKTKAMNKLLSIVVCLLSVHAGIAGGISEKILQIFKQTFPKAEEVKWAEQTDKVTVDFKDGGISTKIEYDKDGNFISSVRYYTEKDLPLNILCKLQKKFPGKTVFGVTEMTTESEVNYYIKLEDATSWMTVKSGQDGNLEITEKYKKAS